MNYKISKYSILNWVIFLIWPFLGFILSLKQIGKKSSLWIFILYFFLIGCSFLLKDQEFDSYRYAEDFINSGLYSSFSLENVFFGKKGSTDIYSSICNYFVLIFTDNPRFLFGLYGSIFGFFLYKVFATLKERTHLSPFVFAYIALGVFMLNPHYNINGVRFWTASYFFLYVVIIYFLEGITKKRLLLLLTLVVLTHGSFLIPSFLLCIFLYFGLNLSHRWYLTFALISFLFMGLKDSSIIEYGFNLLESNGIRFSAYLNADYLQERTEAMESVSVLNSFFRSLSLFYIPVYIFFLLKNNHKLLQSEISFLNFNLLLLSVVNILSFIPSFGRFYVITYSMFFVTLLFFYRIMKFDIYYRCLILFSIPCLSIVYFYNIYVYKDLIISSSYIKGTIFTILDFASNFTFI